MKIDDGYFLGEELSSDLYKGSYEEIHAKKSKIVYISFTPRDNLQKNIYKITVFGIQEFIEKYLINYFNSYFFNETKDNVIKKYNHIIQYSGLDDTYIKELHDLGYLPIEIKSLKDKSLIPSRVPILTIENTNDRFYWLMEYIEILFLNKFHLPLKSKKEKDGCFIQVIQVYEDLEFKIPTLTYVEGLPRGRSVGKDLLETIFIDGKLIINE